MTQPQGREDERYRMPPLGIRPRFLLDEARAAEITEAIHRYVVADREIPADWFTELDEILRRLNARCAASRVRQVGQQQ